MLTYAIVCSAFVASLRTKIVQSSPISREEDTSKIFNSALLTNEKVALNDE
jgi:hypothetical protein